MKKVSSEIEASGDQEPVYVAALCKLKDAAGKELRELQEKAQSMQFHMDEMARYFGEKPGDDKAIEQTFKRIYMFTKSLAA